MNNHNPHSHNHTEPRQDETPAVEIIHARKSYCIGEMEVPLWRERSVGSEYRITIGHGIIWLGPECEIRSVNQRRRRDGVSKGICQHHHRQFVYKDIHHAEKIETYEARYNEIIEYGLETNLPPQKEPGKRGRAKNGSVFILDS